MTQQNTSLADMEARVDSNQKAIFIGAVTGSIMLALQHLTQEAHADPWIYLSAALISVAGWMLFLVAVFRNRKLFDSAEGKIYKEQLQGDERLVTIRNEAFTWGFAAMLIMQVIVLLTWAFFQPHALSIPVAATSTIAAGVTGAVLRYHTLWNR